MDDEIEPGYVLDGKTPVPEPDGYRWYRWFRSTDRRVATTDVGDVVVATAFIGVDCRYDDDAVGPPLLFETIVFGGKLHHVVAHYATWDEAEAGHAAMVARVAEEG